MKEKPILYIVIPCYNEEAVLPETNPMFLGKLHELMEKAERRKEELEAENVQTLIYREEPFIYDCDSISFQVYLMIVRKGVWKQKIMVEKI